MRLSIAACLRLVRSYTEKYSSHQGDGLAEAGMGQQKQDRPDQDQGSELWPDNFNPRPPE